jgi:hypothetical protein
LTWGKSVRHPPWIEADALYVLLVERADEITKYSVGSGEMEEFRAITKALEAYEEQRWSNDKEPGGKG